jgi:hypothetical protein
MEPRFLVTGSGRSGTGYLAAVLREAGLNVAHEGWWTLDHEPIPGLDGDVSWLGCFDTGYKGLVYAQVRNPLQAIPSIYGRENTHPWGLLRRLTVPHTGVWAVDAARIWLDYNRRALEQAESWWRVEDVTESVPVMLGADPDMATKALQTVPRSTNAGELVDYPWPDHPVIDQCLDLACLLGYGIEDPR